MGGGGGILRVLLNFRAEIASECRAEKKMCCATCMKRWLLNELYKVKPEHKSKFDMVIIEEALKNIR